MPEHHHAYGSDACPHLSCVAHEDKKNAEKTAERFYKIRRRLDGEFSLGGSHPKFSKRGKVWRTLGALAGHLNLVCENKQVTNYKDCEIIEIETIVRSVTPVEIHIGAAKQRKKAREERNAKRMVEDRKFQLKHALAEVERLRKECGE